MKHIEELHLTPKEAEGWFDNEQAVHDSNEPLTYQKQMTSPDADIILAIHHLRNRFPFHTVIRHVYGHQDDKKREKTVEKRKGPIIDDPDEVAAWTQIFGENSSIEDEPSCSTLQESEPILDQKGNVCDDNTPTTAVAVNPYLRPAPRTRELSDEAKTNV